MEPPLALPLTQNFWDDLLRNASDWGMVVYEQDWLYTEFLGLNATLQSSATGAKKWLTQMATAASRVGVTVQYCMEMARFRAVWKSTSELGYRPRGQRRADGVGRPKFDFHTGSCCRAPPCRP